MYVQRSHGLIGSLLIALAAAGCSSSGSGGDDTNNSNASVTGDQALSDMLGAFCDFGIRCQSIPVADKETCLALFQAQTGGDMGINSAGAFKESISSGKTTTTRGKLDACVAALRNQSCDKDFEGDFRAIPECDSALTGTVAEGGACISDIACMSGSFCFHSDSAQDVCEATCVKKGGDKCRNDDDCAEGKFCEEEACKVPATAPGKTGDDCSNGKRCEAGLVCLQEADGPSIKETCGTVQGNGGACGREGQCAAGTECSYDSFPATCQTIAPKAKENEACDPGDSGCAEGLVCVPSNDLQSASCLKPKAKGEACTKTFECGGLYSLNYCDSTMKCVPRPKAGAACIVPNPQVGCSLFEAYCDVSDQAHPVCKSFKAAGATCEDNVECGAPGSSSYCDQQNSGQPGTCTTSNSADCINP